MIKLQNISKTYNTGKIAVHALRNINLEIKQGEFVAIMGASGSGKSTLLHILGFLDQPDCGSYLFYDTEITELDDDQCALLRNHSAGFVFQQFHLLPRITALENAELPLIYAGKRHLRDVALEKIRDVGLASRANHCPNEMSGGEQQRTAIARALVNNPPVIFADEPTGNLDTHSESEILKILQELNRQGKTIIMVTHEKEMAAFAKRIISMRDGEIISDEKQGDIHDPGRDMRAHVSTFNPTELPLETSGTGRAKWTDHLRQALHAITSNTMRSLLSSLGILIGVAAVIAMIALGQGAKEAIGKQLSSLGSNLLMVRPGARRMHGVAMEAGSVTRLTLQDAKALAKLSSVRRVSPVVNGRVQIVYGNKNWSTRLQGTGSDYARMRAYVPDAGEFFTEEALRMRQKVVVLGRTVVSELFGDSNPIGSSIKINRIKFRVIGVLPEKGANMMFNRDDIVMVPITTAMYRLLGKDYVNSIDVEIKTSDLIKQAQAEIKAVIIKRHRLNEKNQNSFQVRDMSEIQEAVTSTTKTMTWLLGSIAAISLLVGGIGIMNIMLVSVTERTREIGLRKAVGAQAKDIMHQFLIESIVLTLSGGMMGIALGAGIAGLMAVFIGWATKVSFSSVILATTFSVTVGISFGLWPAYKASMLNPVEALRYE